MVSPYSRPDPDRVASRYRLKVWDVARLETGRKSMKLIFSAVIALLC